MSNYVLSCCSSCDLSEAYLEKIGVPYVPFHFFVNGTDYLDNYGRSMSTDDLYAQMKAGADVKSAQVSLGEYIDYFTPFLKEGKDILHLTLSTGISGSYNAAVSAADILAAEYPDRKIIVIDSLAASSGYGLLMVLLSEKKAAGATIEELRDEALALRSKVNHLFFTTDLTYFIKGGRVSKAEGIIGSLLNICPLLCVSPEGKLVSLLKAKGKKQVTSKMIREMMARIKDGADYQGKCFISHSDCLEDAKTVAALVEQNVPALAGKVEIFPIGTTIGVHTGPGTVALFFIGEEDRTV